MKKQSSYGRILLVRISMLAMTVIAALWWQEKTESMGIVYASETEDVQISDKTQNMELLESMDFTDIDGRPFSTGKDGICGCGQTDYDRKYGCWPRCYKRNATGEDIRSLGGEQKKHFISDSFGDCISSIHRFF